MQCNSEMDWNFRRTVRQHTHLVNDMHVILEGAYTITHLFPGQPTIHALWIHTTTPTNSNVLKYESFRPCDRPATYLCIFELLLDVLYDGLTVETNERPRYELRMYGMRSYHLPCDLQQTSNLCRRQVANPRIKKTLWLNLAIQYRKSSTINLI